MKQKNLRIFVCFRCTKKNSGIEINIKNLSLILELGYRSDLKGYTLPIVAPIVFIVKRRGEDKSTPRFISIEETILLQAYT